MKTAPFSSEREQWIKPEELLLWQLDLYSQKFHRASFSSYANHYRAAIRPVSPNRISQERMEWVVHAVALQRLKGTDGLDNRPADSLRRAVEQILRKYPK